MDAESFWNKVKSILYEQSKNQEWLCEQTGIVIGTLRNWIYYKRLPNVDDGIRIVESLGLTMEQFKLWPDVPSEDVINIPVYEQALSAGKGQEFNDYAEIKDWVALPKTLNSIRKNISASYVRGDSMEPTLFDSDIVLYDRFGYDGTDGIYVINYRSAAFVKRLQRDKDFVRIISDNKKYAEMTEGDQSDDFQVIGRVRYVVHKVQG